jgi:hypothetical protein
MEHDKRDLVLDSRTALTDEYVEVAEYSGLDEHAYFDQGGTTPFMRA